MGVVVVQSRATALVYRVFAALVALLVVMAVVVAVLRLRPDRSAGSPYGGLAAMTPVKPSSAPAVQMAKAADPDATPPAAAAVAAPPATAPPATAPTQAADPAPPADPAAKAEPRRIALDKLAAGSAVPQPAPQARVEAAARAALAPPPAAPAPAPAPQAVAALAPAATAADPLAGKPDGASKPQGSGGININTASEQQLDGLGGGRIGRWIVRHRPYRSIDDLVDHRVLKARDFARIRSAITVD